MSSVDPELCAATDEIFNVLNQIKHLIGMAVCDFTSKEITREKSIKNMENRFKLIQETIQNYFGC